jgi:adenine/guanine phosphoribosyltransferase-like PRPP-binding protein
MPARDAGRHGDQEVSSGAELAASGLPSAARLTVLLGGWVIRFPPSTIWPEWLELGRLEEARHDLVAGIMSGMSTAVVVTHPPHVAEAVESCWSAALVRDRDGKDGRGFLNLKRLLGRPAQFRHVIEALAKTVPVGRAVAAADKGAWPLVGALVLELGVPGVLVRPDPKEHFVAYGGDPAAGDPHLAGERLDVGTEVHLVDDVLYSGRTLRSAMAVLFSAGLSVTEASVIAGANSPDRLNVMLSSSGLERVTCLVVAPELHLPVGDSH